MMIKPEKVSIRKLNKYHELLTDDGKNVTKFFPLSKLKNSLFWEYLPSESSCMGGTMPKFFVRCDSGYFRELIAELSKGNCSYVTYINDLVKSLSVVDADKFPLSRLSIMLKSVHWDKDGFDNEEICSRIANIFGMPTVYNKVVDIEGNRYVASVDYLTKDKELSPVFNDESELIGFYRFDIAKDVVIDGRLTGLLKSGKLSQENFDELVEQFIETYLFRGYIINDDDYNIYNIRLLYDKNKNKYEWAPNFDYECAFDSQEKSDSFVSAELEYILNRYPNIVTKIMQKYKNLLDSDKLCVELNSKYGEDVANKYSKSVYKQIENFLYFYNLLIEYGSKGEPLK